MVILCFGAKLRRMFKMATVCNVKQNNYVITAVVVRFIYLKNRGFGLRLKIANDNFTSSFFGQYVINVNKQH